MPTLVSLHDLVKSAADELRLVHADEPRDAVMKFTECEIELAVTVSADAKGGIKFWVIEAGAGAAYENAQKITLKFSSLDNRPILAAVPAPGAADLPARRK